MLQNFFPSLQTLWVNRLEFLHLKSSVVFESDVRAYESAELLGPHLYGRLLALATNVRLDH
jgi:hypothetical protein